MFATFDQNSQNFGQISYSDFPYPQLMEFLPDDKHSLDDFLNYNKEQEIELINKSRAIRKIISYMLYDLECCLDSDPHKDISNLKNGLRKQLESLQTQRNDIQIQQTTQLQALIKRAFRNIEKSSSDLENYKISSQTITRSITQMENSQELLQSRHKRLIQRCYDQLDKLDALQYKNQQRAAIPSQICQGNEAKISINQLANKDGKGKFKEWQNISPEFEEGKIQIPLRQTSNSNSMNPPNTGPLIIIYSQISKDKTKISIENLQEINASFSDSYANDSHFYFDTINYSFKSINLFQSNEAKFADIDSAYQQFSQISSICKIINQRPIIVILQVSFTKENQFKVLYKKVQQLKTEIQPNTEFFFMVTAKRSNEKYFQSIVKMANEQVTQAGKCCYFQFCQTTNSARNYLNAIGRYINQKRGQSGFDPKQRAEDQIKQLRKEQEVFFNQIEEEGLEVREESKKASQQLLDEQAQKNTIELEMKRKRIEEDNYKEELKAQENLEEIQKQLQEIEDHQKENQQKLDNLNSKLDSLKQNCPKLYNNEELQKTQGILKSFERVVHDHLIGISNFLKEQDEVIRIGKQIIECKTSEREIYLVQELKQFNFT